MARTGDGKVKFRVEGLFEATFTLSGQEDDAIWFLLDVNFLFSVSNARGIGTSAMGSRWQPSLVISRLTPKCCTYRV